MTPKQFAEMNKVIQDTIQETVNGKIDKINTKLDTYMREDNEWKDSVTPSIEIMKKMQGFASVGGYVLKTIILIGAVATAIYTFIKFIFLKK